MNKIIVILIFASVFACKKQESENQNSNKKNIEVEQQKKDSISELLKRNTELLDKIQTSNVSLKCRGNGTRAADVYGSGVTMYFTIQNGTDIGINKVFFYGEFKFSGRSYVYKDEINYEFRNGLEPGEKQEIAMRPGVFTDWNNKIKPADKGDFNLKLLKVEDYNGTLISKKNE
jgi:hypothetical protein